MKIFIFVTLAAFTLTAFPACDKPNQGTNTASQNSDAYEKAVTDIQSSILKKDYGEAAKQTSDALVRWPNSAQLIKYEELIRSNSSIWEGAQNGQGQERSGTTIPAVIQEQWNKLSREFGGVLIELHGPEAAQKAELFLKSSEQLEPYLSKRTEYWLFRAQASLLSNNELSGIDAGLHIFDGHSNATPEGIITMLKKAGWYPTSQLEPSTLKQIYNVGLTWAERVEQRKRRNEVVEKYHWHIGKKGTLDEFEWIVTTAYERAGRRIDSMQRSISRTEELLDESRYEDTRERHRDRIIKFQRRIDVVQPVYKSLESLLDDSEREMRMQEKRLAEYLAKFPFVKDEAVLCRREDELLAMLAKSKHYYDLGSQRLFKTLIRDARVYAETVDNSTRLSYPDYVFAKIIHPDLVRMSFLADQMPEVAYLSESELAEYGQLYDPPLRTSARERFFETEEAYRQAKRKLRAQIKHLEDEFDRMLDSVP